MRCIFRVSEQGSGLAVDAIEPGCSLDGLMVDRAARPAIPLGLYRCLEAGGPSSHWGSSQNTYPVYPCP